ncbi:MAG: hypothetical protein AB1540_04320 [Bdellovibrionota bacterium]
MRRLLVLLFLLSAISTSSIAAQFKSTGELENTDLQRLKKWGDTFILEQLFGDCGTVYPVRLDTSDNEQSWAQTLEAVLKEEFSVKVSTKQLSRSRNGIARAMYYFANQRFVDPSKDLNRWKGAVNKFHIALEEAVLLNEGSQLFIGALSGNDGTNVSFVAVVDGEKNEAIVLGAGYCDY